MARGFLNANTDNVLLSGVPNLTAKLTLSTWLKPRTVPPGSGKFFTIVGKGGSSNDRNFWLDYRNSSGVSLDFNWTKPASTFIEYKVSSPPFTAGVWAHLFWTMDWTQAPAVAKCLINLASQTVSGSSSTTPTTGGTQATRIGSDSTGANSFDGSLAYAGVWSDALGATEAEDLYGGAHPATVRPDALVGAWELDGVNSPEYDASGNGHYGTVTGTTFADGLPSVRVPSAEWLERAIAAPAAPFPYRPRVWSDFRLRR